MTSPHGLEFKINSLSLGSLSFPSLHLQLFPLNRVGKASLAPALPGTEPMYRLHLQSQLCDSGKLVK